MHLITAPLALANLETPIVVIAPDYLADLSYSSSLKVAGEADTTEHCSKLFGRDFNSIRDLRVFLDQFPDSTSMVASMVDPARNISLDVQWTGPLVDQFARYEKDCISQFGKSQAPSHVLEQMILGRMMATSDVAFRSARFGGSPLIDAPTSWQYLLWSYEYNGNIPQPNSDVRDLLITKSLSLSGSEHGMLSGIPPDALVELRREGALTDVRNTIRSGIDDINSASDATLESVGVQVISNIDAALSQHQPRAARVVFVAEEILWIRLVSLCGSRGLCTCKHLGAQFSIQLSVRCPCSDRSQEA